MRSAIQVAGLGVAARGRDILIDIDVRIPSARVTGLIGKNGAGKSTLLKTLVGIVPPSRGSIRFDGGNRLGYLPEYLGFIEHASGLRNLALLGGLRGKQDSEDLAGLLERVGLDPRDKRPVSAYSQGMRRRLGIAQVLMESPDIAILDEPMNGLDPDGIRWFRELSRELANQGVTVIISSHLLGELELSCDYLLMLREGRVAFQGPRRELEQYVSGLRVSIEDEQSARTLQGLFPIHRQGSSEAVVEIDCAPADAVERMVRAGVRLRSVGPATTALEDLYQRLAQ